VLLKCNRTFSRSSALRTTREWTGFVRRGECLLQDVENAVVEGLDLCSVKICVR
jgi:hypothetical protein